MTNYSKAADKENELLKYFEHHGFTGARSAGSHGFWDLIVSPPLNTMNGKTLHIQVGKKTYRDINQLGEVARTHHGLFAHVVIYPRRVPHIRTFFPFDMNNYIDIDQFLMKVYNIAGQDYFEVVNKLHTVKQTTNETHFEKIKRIENIG